MKRADLEQAMAERTVVGHRLGVYVTVPRRIRSVSGSPARVWLEDLLGRPAGDAGGSSIDTWSDEDLTAERLGAIAAYTVEALGDGEFGEVVLPADWAASVLERIGAFR